MNIYLEIKIIIIGVSLQVLILLVIIKFYINEYLFKNSQIKTKVLNPFLYTFFEMCILSMFLDLTV